MKNLNIPLEEALKIAGVKPVLSEALVPYEQKLVEALVDFYVAHLKAVKEVHEFSDKEFKASFRDHFDDCKNEVIDLLDKGVVKASAVKAKLGF